MQFNNVGSVTVVCPYCGKLALCSASKGVWCPHCRNGKIVRVSPT